MKTFAKDAVHFAKAAGDKSLRTIHTGFKKAAEMEDAMKDLMQGTAETIKITYKDGKIVFGLVHPEITPSFSHHINNVKQIPAKVINDLRSKAKEVANKTVEKLKALKKELLTRMETLRAIAKKYAKIIKEKAPVLIAQVKVGLKKYAELLKVNMEKYNEIIMANMKKYSEL